MRRSGSELSERGVARQRLHLQALQTILDDDQRIPAVVQRGDYLYNFWRDATNQRGLWRRTTLDSYCTEKPDWDVVIDVDELARTDDRNWVWAGATVIEPDHENVLSHPHAEVGGGIDYYQWASILRAVSGYRSYNAVYREGLKPWLIAEFLVMREEMPRSLISCAAEIKDCLDRLGEEYGQRHECHRIAGQIYSRLRFGKVEDIFRQGLHEFLSEHIETNDRLGLEISRSYLLG